MTLVSVVIPTYRRRVLVCRAVRSVLQQTYRDLEVVVVIDGNDEDSTQAAVESLGDTRVRVFNTPSRKGPAAARNLGVQLAGGEYIALLDDDDIWLQDKLKKQMGMLPLCEPNGHFLLSCRTLCFDWRTNSGYVAPANLFRTKGDISEYLLDRPSPFRQAGLVASGTLLFPRELALRIPFPDDDVHEGWSWLLRCSQIGIPLHMIEDALFVYSTGNYIGRRKPDWQRSLAWGLRNRAAMTGRAFAGLLSSTTALAAKQQVGLAGLAPLVQAMRKHGNPTLMHWATLFGVMITPLRLVEMSQRLVLAEYVGKKSIAMVLSSPATVLPPEPFRQPRKLALLNNRLTYAVAIPTLTLAGAATTILAPMWLTADAFGRFALLTSIFLYIADFDLGLSRLTDRDLSRPAAGRQDLASLLSARLHIASLVGILTLIEAVFFDFSVAMACVAGIGVMIGNGPLAYYRAKSDIAAFTLVSVLMQFGTTLPRLIGLILGKVDGAILSLALWYSVTALVIITPFAADIRHAPSRLWSDFRTSLPLFLFGSFWLVYLLSHRWIVWLLADAVSLGQFSFGANLVLTGVSLVGAVAQTFYPRHLANPDPSRLSGELFVLIALTTAGAWAGVLLTHPAIHFLFPNFSGAEAATQAMLLSGTPISLCTWLLPLLVARSQRPMLHSLIIFPATIGVLFMLIYAAGRWGNLEMISLMCIPPAFLLLAMMLFILVRIEFITRNAAVAVWLSAVGVELAGVISVAGI